jgi:WD40-like Beta Propeller Repeat
VEVQDDDTRAPSDRRLVRLRRGAAHVIRDDATRRHRACRSSAALTLCLARRTLRPGALTMRTLSLVLSVSICVAASALSSGCGGSSSSGGFSSSGAYLRTPAWSRDGRHLAFVRFLNGYNAIYVMDRDGSHPRRLTGARQDLIDELSSQAWSPDGRKLAFARGPNMSTARGRPTSIFVMNANGTGLRQLTRNNRDDDPAWSPDGPRIAFARYGSTNYGSIYVMNSDGSKERRLATFKWPPHPGLVAEWTRNRLRGSR